MGEITKEALYEADCKKRTGKQKRVPKIAFLREQILLRMNALNAGRDEFYTDEWGALLPEGQTSNFKLAKEAVEEELKNMKDFLIELQLPVNDGWGGSHCCALGIILLRC